MCLILVLNPIKVLYADYKRQHSIDIIKQELIPSLNKIKIEPTGDSFKTPARPKRTDKEGSPSQQRKSGPSRASRNHRIFAGAGLS